MKAVFLDFATVASDTIDVSPLQQITKELTLYDHTPSDRVTERIRGCELVYLNKVQITSDIIRASSSLKFIGLIATGVDNIDLETAQQKNIAVCNIRAYCSKSVVEHVFGILLQLTHNLSLYHRSVRKGNWELAQNFCLLNYPIRQLSRMTLGIVGYGELGKAVAKMARAFGMNVLISGRAGLDVSADKTRTNFEDVLRESDVISLHCPLTADTTNLIGASELNMMKTGAILINTARGRLVDSVALIRALENGIISAAGIDVLAEEPPVNNDPILDYDGDNLIVTPHIAWATVEARQNAINEVALNAQAFLAGNRRNRVI